MAVIEAGCEEGEMAGNSDLKAHEATYDRVIALLKWGAVGVAIIAVGVILIIAR